MEMKPGYSTTEELWSPNEKNLKKFVDKNMIPFIFVNPGDLCFDLGEANPRIKYLKERLNIKVEQIEADDFNFDELPDKKADVVFAFEVVEHLQNPLWFMKQLKKLTDDSIYIMYPCNPHWLWHPMHFHEMSKKHFEKWILKPLDLKIVRYKRITFVFTWRTYLIGFRPLIKLLTGKMTLQNMMRRFFYIQWRIYEIRANN